MSRVTKAGCSNFQAGPTPLGGLVSPYADDCSQAKSLFPKGNLPNLTGVSAEHEPPKDEAVELDGLAPLDQNVEALVNLYFV